MSIPWPDCKQEGVNLLDSTLSNFLSFDFSDQLEPIEPVVDAIPDTTTIPSDTTFDWSNGIDPSLCQWQWPNPGSIVIESPAGSDSTSGEVSKDEQSLKQTILQLANRLDRLEQGVEARLSEIEANIGDMGQRLMKAEEAKETHDAEYVPLGILQTIEFR